MIATQTLSGVVSLTFSACTFLAPTKMVIAYGIASSMRYVTQITPGLPLAD